MSRIVSDRADKTDQEVGLPSSLEDASKSPPGLYRIGVGAACGSILAFFTALVIAYMWRAQRPPYWDPIRLPGVLGLSPALILASSATFEYARRVFRKGRWRTATHLLIATACLGAAFLATQLTAWRTLI